MEELKDARLFDITKPRRFGGLEMGWDTFSEVAIKIGAGCGSTGWVFSVLGQHPLLVNRIGIDCMEEIWSENRDALIAATKWQSGSLRKADGGYRGSGISTFGSGCLHSEWVVIGGAPVEDSDEVVGAVLPMGDIEILDSWRTDGLVGTGSHHIRLGRRLHPRSPGAGAGQAARGAGSSTRPSTAPPASACRSACRRCSPASPCTPSRSSATTMRDRKSRDGARIADIQSVQMRIGESAAEIDAALALIRSHMRSLMATLEGLPPPTGAGGYEHGKWPQLTGKGIAGGEWPAPGTGDDSAHIATANSMTARLAYSAVERLSYAAGADRLDHDDPLLRCLRDATAGVRQYGINWDVARTRSGKSFLGVG